jgi:hypothetical protein
MTCLRRLRYWQQIGTWDRIRQILQRSHVQLEGVNWGRVENLQCQNEQMNALALDAIRKTGRRMKARTRSLGRSLTETSLPEQINSREGDA